MRTLLLLCIIACAKFTNLYSQTLENVRTAFSGDKVIITYDLTSGDPSQRFKITAFSAHDNYSAPLQHVTGAVGENVAPGRGLRIEWDARSSLPSDFNGTISVRLKGVAIPQLKGLDQSVYKKGSGIDVSWTGGGKTDKMNIELLRDGVVYKQIGSGIDNNNSFSWKIPNNVKAGKNYSIRLSDITDPMQPSTSTSFEIKPKIPLLVKLAVPVAVGAAVVIILNGGGSGPTPPPADDTLPPITVKPN